MVSLFSLLPRISSIQEEKQNPERLSSVDIGEIARGYTRAACGDLARLRVCHDPGPGVFSQKIP